jgi:site-specific recombinase XerD
MKKKAKPPTPPLANFSAAIRGFMGYLEGTHKARHTLKNYRLDLEAFQAFLSAQRAGAQVDLDQLDLSDLERFHDALQSQGLKANTRRRKLLTVRRFLVYWVGRKKLPQELARKTLTPTKIERVPRTLDHDELIRAVLSLPRDTALDRRNRALVWTLAETGCQVSELVGMRFDDFGPREVRVTGKSPRTLAISAELRAAIAEVEADSKSSPWVFPGFNKFGSLGAAISPRGVELLVKHLAPALGLGELTPRTFRSSAVLHWHLQGAPRSEIQDRLGLKTPYAFRNFEPIFSKFDAASGAGHLPSTE